MNATAKQASLVIDSVAKAVANWTVDQHAEARPQLAQRYGDAWRADWIGHTLSQVHMLAQAVAVQSPDLFAHSVRWTSESFRQRGVDEADLLQNTRCLREVLAKELPPPVGKRATAFVDASIEVLASAQPGFDEGPREDEGHREFVLEYLKCVLDGDRTAAEAAILGRFDAGMTVPEIYESILAPAEARLGWMWHRGEISVADEHFGSATTQAVMSQLRPHFKRAAPNGRMVVATATPGDLHEIGLRMVADLFEIDGWKVIYLGANMPTADLVELLERRRPDLLALSVSTGLTLRDAGEMIEQVRQASGIAGTKVLIGGPPLRAIDGLWRELGADGCAISATDAVSLGNKLVAG